MKTKLSKIGLISACLFFSFLGDIKGKEAPSKTRSSNLSSSLQSVFQAGSSNLLKLDAQVMEAYPGDQKVVARGKVCINYKDIYLEADEVEAYYRQKEVVQDSNSETQGHEIWQLKAKGGLRIIRPQQSVYGDEGIYDLDKDMVRVTGGNLKLISENAEVTAQKSLEFWRKESKGIAEGKALVRTKDNRTVQADQMVAYFSEPGEDPLTLLKVVGTGGVTISTGQEVASGQEGLYDHKKEIAILKGQVEIQRGLNSLKGHEAEVNLKTGVSRLTSHKGKPISALLVPEKKEGKNDRSQNRKNP